MCIDAGRHSEPLDELQSLDRERRRVGELAHGRIGEHRRRDIGDRVYQHLRLQRDASFRRTDCGKGTDQGPATLAEYSDSCWIDTQPIGVFDCVSKHIPQIVHSRRQ
ncbi:hypothetical protein GCM10027278_17340 [Paralcaligenes ginsengisoli]